MKKEVKVTARSNGKNILLLQGDWTEPISLDATSQLPAFPVEALPETGREMVKMVTEINQVDAGLTGTIFLSILSTCLAKHAVVNLKTHTEPLNIYVCSILPSGERKSVTLSLMKKPIDDYMSETKAVIFVDDITSEKLGSIMAENGERIAILSSEGGTFSNIAGRYGKQNPNLDLFLKAHAGDFWSSHRISRETEIMHSPALTLCLTVQPDVIKTIGSNEQFRGRGLLARFLYSYCEPKAGFRMRQKKALSRNLSTQYNEHILHLINLPFQERRLKLEPQARKMWDNFYDQVESELRPGGKLYLLQDWGSKLSGAVARISGLFHMAVYGESAEKHLIETDTVAGAIEIGKYYMEHAIATFCFMGENPSIESAKKILEYIKRNGVNQFRGRDIIRHTGLRTMAEVNPGVKVLMERCYVKEYSAERNGKGRPEGATYLVNPLCKIA